MFIVPLSGLQGSSSMAPIESVTKVAAEEKENKTETFGDILKAKIQSVKDLETQSLQSAMDVSMGVSSDVESAMIDATKASTAIELTVQLTTRAVNAYKDIMSMQI